MKALLLSALFFGAFTPSYAQQTWATVMISGTSELRSVAWSPTLNLLVAVGDGMPNGGRIFSSSDALNWPLRNSPTVGMNEVAWGSGLYVAVGKSGRILTSTNGTAWIQQTSGTNQELLGVAWISPTLTGTGKWMAVGASGTILTSPNGTAWTPRTSGITTSLGGIAWTSALGSAAGAAVAVGNNGRILTSIDTAGATWTSQSSGTTSNLTAVAWGNGKLYAVGMQGTIRVSTNGTSWAAATNTGLSPVNSVQSIVWAPPAEGGLGFVIPLEDDSRLRTSLDGTTWVTGTLTNASCYASVWAGTRHVVVGSNGNISVSLPPAPTLKTPLDSSINVPVATRLNWSALPGVTYEVQVSTSAVFSSLLRDTTVADTGYNVPGLAYNIEYFWRVRAVTAPGVSPWSVTRKFRTIMAVPASPVWLSPLQNAVNVFAYDTLKWIAQSSATHSRVQLATDTTFTALVLDDSTISVQTSGARAFGPLAYGTVFYARVNARNAGGTGLWSAPRKFTTEAAPTGPPAAPALIFPEQYAENISRAPALSWLRVAGGQTYQVQLSVAANFATLLLNDSLLPGTSRVPDTLMGNVAYYWRVRARNSFGVSPWSEIRTFVTVASVPAAPTLSSPAAFATGVASPASLAWNAVAGASTYHVQVSLGVQFSSLAFLDSNITGLTKTTGSLAGMTQHYWRVRAKNVAGVGAWSSTFRFTTGETQVIGVAMERRMLEGMRFDGLKTLRFDLPRAERVVIRIYDLRGGIERILLDEIRPAGAQDLQLPADVRRGLHVLDFRIGTFHETVKVLF